MCRIIKSFVVFIFVFVIAQATFAAVYTVTKTADTDDGFCNADCSLREAIRAADNTPTNDVIDFDFNVFVNPQTITLSGSELVITGNGTLRITGLSADRLTIDGNNASRIISNGPNAVTSISEITFKNGNGVGAANSGRGGAIYNNGGILTLNNLIITGNRANTGGGTNSAGSGSIITINNSVISNNTSNSSGGGMQNFSNSTLIISNSTINGNTSGGATGGGGMQANGMVKITNSTITSNNAPSGSGGGISYNGTGMTLTNVTIVENTSTNNGGGVHKSTSNPNAFWRNTIVAENNGASNSPDVTGGIDSEGNNLIGNAGTSTGWITSDITNQPAGLSPLGFYGGRGLTYIPLSGSPALDAGQNCVINQSCEDNNAPISANNDQRGASRPSNLTVDIGAVEASDSYFATLPNAVYGQNYNLTIAPDSSGFIYLLLDGGFGGINLVSGAKSTTLTGFPTQLGSANSTVQITNGINSTVVNYSIAVYGSGFFSVSGTVNSSSSQTIRLAIVTLTDENGNVLVARTNPFGNFYFENVPSGIHYITAYAKGFQFATKGINVLGTVTDLNINALPQN
jgi:CSLREA domain-containing protein